MRFHPRASTSANVTILHDPAASRSTFSAQLAGKVDRSSRICQTACTIIINSQRIFLSANLAISTMVERSIVSCQIPQDWKAKIEQLAALRKQDPSQILFEALAQYLGEDVNTNDTRLNALETEVTALRASISQLEGTVKELQLRSPLVPTWNNSTVASVESLADEDFLDEPDEILIDFLPPEERY
ncbi:MAG: hypothetical protein HC786_03490 [Richelia sp. CSU_2_1]|nr:hypothetical protein [Richelia sp. CSU_2_1]